MDMTLQQTDPDPDLTGHDAVDTKAQPTIALETTGITKNEDGQDDVFGEYGDAQDQDVDASGEFGDAQHHDDDGFGDFGEVQTGGGEDDDFGDFNDFGANDEFPESDDFGTFEDGDDFGSTGTVVVDPLPTAQEQEPTESAPDFTAVNSRQVENYVLERLSDMFSVKDQTLETVLNQDLDDLDVASILADQVLWASLCEQSFQGNNAKSASLAPQFQWKNSTLRQVYYASLGLVATKEQTTIVPSSIPNSISSPASKSKVSSPLIVSTESMPARKPLDLEASRSFCQFTKENLGGYSGNEMKDIILQLTELTRQASDELTYWLDQREQMLMDSERYNEMIASLVGRAAKLKDAESKQATKSKRLTRTSFNLK